MGCGAVDYGVHTANGGPCKLVKSMTSSIAPFYRIASHTLQNNLLPPRFTGALMIQCTISSLEIKSHVVCSSVTWRLGKCDTGQPLLPPWEVCLRVLEAAERAIRKSAWHSTWLRGVRTTYASPCYTTWTPISWRATQFDRRPCLLMAPVFSFAVELHRSWTPLTRGKHTRNPRCHASREQ